MHDDTIPSKYEVLHDLEDVLVLISQAIDYGIFKAKEFAHRENNGKIDDRSMAAHHARYFAIKYLRFHGHSAVEEAEDDPYAMSSDPYSLQRVPNTGILLKSGRYQIRIRRAQNGGIPAPGESTSRQLYYQQAQGKLNFPDLADPPPKGINLITYWDVVVPYEFSALAIACPKYAKATQSSVEVWWEAPLPLIAHYPIMKYVQSEIDDDDLDLELDGEAAAGGDGGEDDD